MKTKIIILILLSIITFSACVNKRKSNEKPSMKKNDALIIGNPFDYGMDNILIFPVGANYKPVIYEEESKSSETKLINNNLEFKVNGSTSLYDRIAEKEYINSDEDKFDIRNILFYNLKTGITYPLIKDTLHILSFAMHREFGKPLIFYRIVKKDYNNDSIFNSKDPVILYISDIYGREFIQITPENEQFADYSYYKQTETILIRTIIDSDKDKSFTNYDETNFREMKILEPAFAREIFKKSLKDSLRAQLKTF